MAFRSSISAIIICFFIIWTDPLYGWSRRTLRARKAPLDEIEMKVQKKSFAALSLWNRLPFLYYYGRRQSDMLLLPHEQRHKQLLEIAVNKALSLKQKNQPSPFFAFIVRVLLDEKKEFTSQESWHIKSEKGFFVHPAGHPEKKQLFSQNLLQIKKINGILYVNDKPFGYNIFFIIPREGFLSFEGNCYQGSFVVALHDDRAHLISQLDIEDYIFSVLRWESWPGWPIEVNKAFAIACRSYLIAKVLKAKKQKYLFHIKNTNIHQTYNGLHQFHNLKQAIEETRGLILTYKKKPIEAMFDSCCGSVIPAKLSGINFTDAPYLARTYPCHFCKTCKIYTWNVEYSSDELADILRSSGFSVDTIKDIKITKKDAAGAAQEILIIDTKKIRHCTGKQMYSMLSKIKSFCYDIERKGKNIVFSGRGYGHHLGICQWGARRMVDAGWHYRSILQFYYPGTTLMELKNSS